MVEVVNGSRELLEKSAPARRDVREAATADGSSVSEATSSQRIIETAPSSPPARAPAQDESEAITEEEQASVAESSRDGAEPVERLSLAELLRQEPATQEELEKLLAETKVAAAYAESERQRLEYEVHVLTKRVHALEQSSRGVHEAYEALKDRLVAQEEQLQRERKLRKSLEVKLRDIDGDWHV